MKKQLFLIALGTFFIQTSVLSAASSVLSDAAINELYKDARALNGNLREIFTALQSRMEKTHTQIHSSSSNAILGEIFSKKHALWSRIDSDLDGQSKYQNPLSQLPGQLDKDFSKKQNSNNDRHTLQQWQNFNDNAKRELASALETYRAISEEQLKFFTVYGNSLTALALFNGDENKKSAIQSEITSAIDALIIALNKSIDARLSGKRDELENAKAEFEKAFLKASHIINVQQAKPAEVAQKPPVNIIAPIPVPIPVPAQPIIQQPIQQITQPATQVAQKPTQELAQAPIKRPAPPLIALAVKPAAKPIPTQPRKIISRPTRAQSPLIKRPARSNQGRINTPRAQVRRPVRPVQRRDNPILRRQVKRNAIVQQKQAKAAVEARRRRVNK